jgi:hypothetical protein
MGNTKSNPPPYETTDNVSSDKRVISHEKLNAKTQEYINKTYDKALSTALEYINRCVLEEAEIGGKQFVFSPGHILTTNINCTCCCSKPADFGWDKSWLGAVIQTMVVAMIDHIKIVVVVSHAVAHSVVNGSNLAVNQQFVKFRLPSKIRHWKLSTIKNYVMK